MTAPIDNSRVLTQSEMTTLAAIADRIFPATETPGAVEIGSLDYIECALKGDYAPLVPLYRAGLRFVDRWASKKFGRQFHALTQAQQDAVLGDLEGGSAAGFAKATEFFDMVRYHVLEGIFCEPQYGGNRNMTGWRLVNFPGQQFGYADAYVNKVVDLEPVAVTSSKTEEK